MNSGGRFLSGRSILSFKRSRQRPCQSRYRPLAFKVSDGSDVAAENLRTVLGIKHHTPVVIDDRDIVVISSPINSTKQRQGIPPEIGDSVVPGGVVRRPNRRTRRSVISVAVHDSSPPQDLVLSKSSRLGNNIREVNPAAGSGNGISPITARDLPPGAPFSRKSSNDGRHQASPGGRPRQEQILVLRPLTHPYQPIRRSRNAKNAKAVRPITLSRRATSGTAMSVRSWRHTRAGRSRRLTSPTT
ncbi:Uncharacterised protein [Mycobacterium xenopi]|uniref:Uncharacterized protein n=1 Tax=Mycobacterium xenopi TaxID=1789 RepID=A0AAD1H0G2_MYCXE|nr:hypothetical protein MYXE_19350 [Mycobacterium xenopi]SPX77988.1 Uncharacterised protein [Mycobacterium xenopi]